MHGKGAPWASQTHIISIPNLKYFPQNPYGCCNVVYSVDSHLERPKTVESCLSVGWIWPVNILDYCSQPQNSSKVRKGINEQINHIFLFSIVSTFNEYSWLVHINIWAHNSRTAESCKMRFTEKNASVERGQGFSFLPTEHNLLHP